MVIEKEEIGGSCRMCGEKQRIEITVGFRSPNRQKRGTDIVVFNGAQWKSSLINDINYMYFLFITTYLQNPTCNKSTFRSLKNRKLSLMRIFIFLISCSFHLYDG